MPSLGDASLLGAPSGAAFLAASDTRPPGPPLLVVDPGVLDGELVAPLAVGEVRWGASPFGAGVLDGVDQNHVGGVLAGPVRARHPKIADPRVMAGVIDVFPVRDVAVMKDPAVPVGQASSSPVGEREHERGVSAGGQGSEPRPAVVGTALVDLLPVTVGSGVGGASKDPYFKRSVPSQPRCVGGAVAVRRDGLVATLHGADGPDPFASPLGPHLSMLTHRGERRA